MRTMGIKRDNSSILNILSNTSYIFMCVFYLLDFIIFHGCLYRVFENSYRIIDIRQIILILSILVFISVFICFLINMISLIKNKKVINIIILVFSLIFSITTLISLFIVGVL